MKTQTTTKSTDKQKVACAFYRVSTDDQNTERQYADVRNHCKAYDIEIIYEKQEIISGAAKLEDRADLLEFLKYVDEHRPDFVIVSELSRLARSQDAVTIIKKWADQGICFLTHKEGIRTLDENGQPNAITTLLLQIMSAINEFELSTIQYRVKSGLRKTVNKGTWSGGNNPYGFDIKDQKLVINDESVHVKFMFDKYSQGWGTHRIASHLNINNIPTKENKQWTDPKIYKILSNPIYVGKRKWNKETIEQPELRIIDDSTFASVQDRLTNKTNTTDINKQSKHDYLLKGLILCQCGKHFVGQSRHNIYMCASKKYGGGCNIKSVKINWLDDQIQKHLILNYNGLLNDYRALEDKSRDYQDEVQHIQSKIDEEKLHQNYLINNITKIGQRNFDLKYDASTELVNTLQKQIDDLLIKLSNTKIYIDTTRSLAAINMIDDDQIQKILNYQGVESTVERETIKKIIQRIDIDNHYIKVQLIDDSTFNIERPKK